MNIIAFELFFGKLFLVFQNRAITRARDRASASAMTSEHKLQTMAKLCHDVLAAVPDGQLPLDGAC